METNLKSTKLFNVVKQYEIAQKTKFKPTTEFYKQLNISHIRFGKLLKGTAIISGPEAVALAGFFKVPLTEIL